MCARRRIGIVVAWLLAALVVLHPLSAVAQAPLPANLPEHPRYAIAHFGDRLGLGAATVTALAQDSLGFLWIGTHTGVYRYDGASVHHFGPEEGLPGQHVSQILVAPDGTLWVCTTKAVARFTGERFVPAPILDSRESLRDGAQTFAVSQNGALFLATERGILRLRTANSNRDAVAEAQDASLANAGAIVRGPDDTIWFSANRRIWRFRPGEETAEFFYALPVETGAVLALVADAHKRLWVRTLSHLGSIELKNGAPRELVLHDAGVPGANMYGAPSLDRGGNLLLPTSSGLFRWAEDHWQVTDHQSGLTSSAVFAALEDREGTIWVGLAGAGLDRWPGSERWSGWTDADGLPDALVLRVLRDARSRLWVGTNNGLAAWDPGVKRWRTWTAANGLAGSGVTELVRTPDGALWQLSYHVGVTRIDASTAEPALRRVPHTGEWPVVGMAAARDGSVWVSTENGLSNLRFERGTFHEQSVAIPPEAARRVRALAFDASGALWTGGPAGLARYSNGSGGQWRTYGKADGLLGENVRDLRFLGENELWIGYQDEDAATRARIQPDARLATEHIAKGVCALGMDRSRQVWLELQQGAGRWRTDGTLRHFTQGDGLLWDDVNCGAFWQDADGAVLIGSSRGLVRYDPGQEIAAPQAPPVVITSAKFGNRERLAENNARVFHQDGTFQIEFAAMTFRDSDRLQCRYRLRDLETDFTETSQRVARYASLPSGEYTFEVSCGSNELGWSAQPVTYAFALEPPWWQESWARLTGVLLALLVIWSYTQIRTRRLRRERARLEDAVETRNAELALANAELQEASLTDPLTRVRNRRFFQMMMPADIEQALRAYRGTRTGQTYSTDHRELVFFLVDLDRFKSVNDEHGHDGGDRVLIQVAERLRKIVRQSDYLVRWGGEEFLIVCRAAERAEAHIFATKILESISGEPMDLGNGRQTRCSCSIGWAPYPWSHTSPDAISLEEALKCADRGLYFAKDRGRARAIGVVPRDPDAAPLYEGASLRMASFRIRGIAAMEICTESASTAGKDNCVAPDFNRLL